MANRKKNRLLEKQPAVLNLNVNYACGSAAPSGVSAASASAMAASAFLRMASALASFALVFAPRPGFKGFGFGAHHIGFLAVYFRLFGLLPLGQFLVGLFLRNRAFDDPYLQMFFIQYAKIGEHRLNSRRGLRPFHEPFKGFFLVQYDGGRIGERVVRSE